MIRENFTVLTAYAGTAPLFALYLAAFVCLLLREKERWKRYLFLYMPAALLLFFLFSPLRLLFMLVFHEADTYYRLLWLIPCGMTIAYAAVSLFEQYRIAVFAVACVLIMLCGSLVYNDAIITRAENRFHLSQVMIDVVNVITGHREREADAAIGACLPPEFVQQARQYEGRLYLSFGRSEVHWGYWNNEVYNLYRAEVIDTEALDRLLGMGATPFLVLPDAKLLSASPADFGWEEIAALHGYRVWYRESYDHYFLMRQDAP